MYHAVVSSFSPQKSGLALLFPQIVAYTWSLSSTARNHAVYVTMGNLPTHYDDIMALPPHERNRRLLCILCERYLGRRQWARKMRPRDLLDDDVWLARIVERFPDVEVDQWSFRAGLCLSCQTRLSEKGRAKSAQHFSIAQTRMSRAKADAERRRRPPCVGGDASTCTICTSVDAQQFGHRQIKRQRASEVDRSFFFP